MKYKSIRDIMMGLKKLLTKPVGTVISPPNKVIIYQSELDYLSKCIIESPRIETGGNLFGLQTPFGIPVIHYIVGPGPNAVHNQTHFRQDYEFLDRNADYLVKEHALHHIGSWHSHHSLDLMQPSSGDTESTLSGMKECNLPSFILLIGNYRHGKSTVNAFRYFSNGECMKLKWIILKGESPFRLVYDKAHPSLLYTPYGNADMMALEESTLINNEEVSPPQPPVFDKSYWLSVTENRKELAKIINFLQTKFEKVSIYQTDNSTVEIKIGEPSTYKFVFNKTFPREAPKLFAPRNQELRYKSIPEWDTADKSISESFIHFFKTIKL